MKRIETPRLSERSGVLLVMAAAAMWGTVGVAAKTIYAISVTNSLSIGFFRLALAVPILLVMGWATLGKRMWQVGRAELGLMLLMGSMTAIYQVCYYAAIAQTGVMLATLVTLCTAPLFVTAFSVWWTKERLTKLGWLALGCAIAGTGLLVTVRPEFTGNQSLTKGVSLALVSALVYAVVTLISRNLATRCHPLQAIAISFIFGAALLGLCAFATNIVITYSPLGWSLLFYLGLVPTAFAYGLFLTGMRHTPATVASTASLIEPLTATVLAWLIFGERFNRSSLFGALLLLSAMLLLYVNSRRR